MAIPRWPCLPELEKMARGGLPRGFGAGCDGRQGAQGRGGASRVAGLAGDGSSETVHGDEARGGGGEKRGREKKGNGVSSLLYSSGLASGLRTRA